MKDKIIYIALAILAVAVILLGMQATKGSSNKSERTIDTLYIPFNDSWHEKLVPYPQPYVVEVPGAPGATITIPAIIDTMAVIKDYYSKRFYRDSLKNDSIDMFVNYMVHQNKAYDVKMSYKWHLPQMIIKQTDVVRYQNLYFGLDITGAKEHFGIYPSAYLDFNKGMAGYGYDFINNYHKIGIYYKARWKKRIKK